MLSNTGTVSFILYSVFIILAMIGLFIAIYYIRKDNIPPEKLDKIIDLTKYTILSVAIATVSLIVSNLFKEREQDIKELEYFDKYVQDVKKADGLAERYQLSKYLSIVAPSGELQLSWKHYYDTLTVEYQEYLRNKKESKNLDTVAHPSLEQEYKKAELDEKTREQEKPLASSNYTLIPRVYIQIADENQRAMGKSLQSILIHENFLAPGVENIGRIGKIEIPSKTEVRYYREEELPDALRLISLLEKQNIGGPINETPQKVPGNGKGTRPGHLEIWFSKNK